MARHTSGLHHVTAIAGDPQANVDFYSGLLGLRLVKRTVNFDDPTTYHLYYGDELGRPGTILTFFPWPGAPRGRQGTGQVTVAAFTVPGESLPYWRERLDRYGVSARGPEPRFDEVVLSFEDGDGLQIELVATADEPQGTSPWAGGPVPPEHAIRAFHGITISLEGYERTAHLLTDTLGLRLGGEQGARFRYESPGPGPGRYVDLLCLPDTAPGRVAVGTVHHVAFRAADADQQVGWRGELAELGFNITPVIDRQYFRSIYFREPGGVLFEIATDPPGMTVDEDATELGSGLRLPPWYEKHRAEIEQVLPPLRPPRLQRERVGG